MQSMRVVLFAEDPRQEEADRAEVSKHLGIGIMEPSVSLCDGSGVGVE
jgi:hypothetical protein